MEIDVERQQRAREYAQKRRRLSFLNMGIGVLCLCVFLGASLDIWLRDRLASFANSLPFLNWSPQTNWYPLQILLYFVIAMLIYELLTLPVIYYSGFVLSHRYGMSVMSLKAWIKDLIVSFSLSLILETAFISLVYALLAWQPETWWLWVALTILFFSVIMANLAPVLIFPLFYKFTPLQDEELTRRLTDLAARANTRIRGVFQMKMSHKTTATNAALMGLGNTRRVVLGDTMIDRYTPDEIEVILAHELGHHVHRDIWKLIISQAILTLAGLYIANLCLHWAITTFNRYHGLTDPATLPLFFILMGLFGLIIMPVTNGYSRHIEYQADEYALASTGKVVAFKSAMTRLANQNLAVIEPSPIVEFFFYSHPSIKKRLAHADTFLQRHPQISSAAFSADS